MLNLSSLLTFAPAVAGYLFTYWHTKTAEERKQQIERKNEQLRELYGPLLACVTATQSAYAAMIESSLPGATAAQFRAAVQSDINGRAAQAYRYWMRHVLQPLNERAADIIVTRIDLLESDCISELMLQLVAHVSANRVVLKHWEDGDLDSWSAITYPDKLTDHITRQFSEMKQSQASLLGVKLQAKL